MSEDWPREEPEPFSPPSGPLGGPSVEKAVQFQKVKVLVLWRKDALESQAKQILFGQRCLFQSFLTVLWVMVLGPSCSLMFCSCLFMSGCGLMKDRVYKLNEDGFRG